MDDCLICRKYFWFKISKHTQLNINGSDVMFSDVFPGMLFVTRNNFSLTIVSDSLDEVKYSFNKMKAGGTVNLDLQETFWSKCYGSLTDTTI